MKDTFKGSVIDDEQHEALLQDLASKDKIEHSNGFPMNIIKLEELFDLQDKFRIPTNTKTSSSSLQYEDVNLNTEQNPLNINLGNFFTHSTKESFMKLFK